MYFLLLSLLAVGALAQNVTPSNPFANCTLTVDMVNQAIKRIEADRQYFPDYVADPIIKATEQEKQEFVTFSNDLMSGKFASTPVNDVEQFLQLIQQKAPSIYAKGLAMHKAFMEKVSGLNDEAKRFVGKWMKKWAEMVKSLNKGNAFQTTYNFNKEFFTDAKNLSTEAKDSLKKQFPECAKAWAERPELTKFAEFMINAPNSTDFKKFEDMVKLMNNAATPAANLL